MKNVLMATFLILGLAGCTASRGIVIEDGKPSVEAALGAVSILPFVDHKLREYFPAVDITIEGRPMIAHLDTGAPWLIMSRSTALDIGIELSDAGKGFHGRNQVNRYRGTAKTLQFGNATLVNVPVTVLETVNRVIFGTNILRQFLSTVDSNGERTAEVNFF